MDVELHSGSRGDNDAFGTEEPEREVAQLLECIPANLEIDPDPEQPDKHCGLQPLRPAWHFRNPREFHFKVVTYVTGTCNTTGRCNTRPGSA